MTTTPANEANGGGGDLVAALKVLAKSPAGPTGISPGNLDMESAAGRWALTRLPDDTMVAIRMPLGLLRRLLAPVLAEAGTAPQPVGGYRPRPGEKPLSEGYQPRGTSDKPIVPPPPPRPKE
jgi:hypothetical protein